MPRRFWKILASFETKYFLFFKPNYEHQNLVTVMLHMNRYWDYCWRFNNFLNIKDKDLYLMTEFV